MLKRNYTVAIYDAALLCRKSAINTEHALHAVCSHHTHTPPHGVLLLSQQRRAVFVIETTLSQAWFRNSIREPQCAFEMSMFMCPAVHKLTRN